MIFDALVSNVPVVWAQPLGEPGEDELGNPTPAPILAPVPARLVVASGLEEGATLSVAFTDPALPEPTVQTVSGPLEAGASVALSVMGAQSLTFSLANGEFAAISLV